MQLSIYIFFIAIEPILVESRGRAQFRVSGDFWTRTYLSYTRYSDSTSLMSSLYDMYVVDFSLPPAHNLSHFLSLRFTLVCNNIYLVTNIYMWKQFGHNSRGAQHNVRRYDANLCRCFAPLRIQRVREWVNLRAEDIASGNRPWDS